MSDLRMFRGDSRTWVVNFKDKSTGNPIDITGYTLFFTVKDKNRYLTDASDSSAIISKNVTTHVDSSSGISQIVITSSDTTSITPKAYIYDIQLKDSYDRVFTIDSGNFLIDADVTRRTL
jgi:hypothetical protein